MSIRWSAQNTYGKSNAKISNATRIPYKKFQNIIDMGGSIKVPYIYIPLVCVDLPKAEMRETNRLYSSKYDPCTAIWQELLYHIQEFTIFPKFIINHNVTMAMFADNLVEEYDIPISPCFKDLNCLNVEIHHDSETKSKIADFIEKEMQLDDDFMLCEYSVVKSRKAFLFSPFLSEDHAIDSSYFKQFMLFPGQRIPHITLIDSNPTLHTLKALVQVQPVYDMLGICALEFFYDAPKDIGPLSMDDLSSPLMLESFSNEVLGFFHLAPNPLIEQKLSLHEWVDLNSRAQYISIKKSTTKKSSIGVADIILCPMFVIESSCHQLYCGTSVIVNSPCTEPETYDASYSSIDFQAIVELLSSKTVIESGKTVDNALDKPCESATVTSEPVITPSCGQVLSQAVEDSVRERVDESDTRDDINCSSNKEVINVANCVAAKVDIDALATTVVSDCVNTELSIASMADNTFDNTRTRGDFFHINQLLTSRRVSFTKKDPLKVLISPVLYNQNIQLIGELNDIFHISTVEYGPIDVPPISIIVDALTAICLVSLLPSDSKRVLLKDILRQLTTVMFKYKVIWVVLIGNTALREEIMDDDSISLFFQSVARFPVNIYVRHTDIVLLAQLIEHICLDSLTRMTVACDITKGKYTHRPFIEKHILFDYDEGLIAQSEFLQVFPTVNAYVALQLLCQFNLSEIGKIRKEDAAYENLQKIFIIEDWCDIFLSIINTCIAT